MGGCASAPAEKKERRETLPDVCALAESYFEHHRSLRAQERHSLNRVLLSSRVEHDSSAPASGRSLAESESGRSASELETQSVALSQAHALERYNSSLSRRSASSTGSLSRSSSCRSPEEAAAHREARRQARLQKEEEELALAMAVSASEAEAVAAVLAEPIAVEDAQAIAAAAAELAREDEQMKAADAAAAAAEPARAAARPAPVRTSLSASGSFCETIREAAEEEAAAESATAEAAVTAPGLLPLRDRYTTTVAVPKQYSEAERRAYQRIMAEVGRGAQPAGLTAPSGEPGAPAQPKSPFARHTSAPQASLEHIAEHSSSTQSPAAAGPPRRESSLSKQRRRQEAQACEAQAWRQTSLDSAFDLHNGGMNGVVSGKQRRVSQSQPQPRGFMVA